MGTDNRSDAGGDVWLTYAELAGRLGIAKASAERRAARSGWRRTAGNDGRARVAVPANVLTTTGEDAAPAARGVGASIGGVAGDVMDPMVLRLAAEVEALRGEAAARGRELAAAREEVARTRGEADGLRVAVEVAQREADRAREDASAARQDADRAGREAAAVGPVREALEAARADLRRVEGRGFLARLLGR